MMFNMSTLTCPRAVFLNFLKAPHQVAIAHYAHVVLVIAVGFCTSSIASAETLASPDGFTTSSGNISCVQNDLSISGGDVNVFCIRLKPSPLMASIAHGRVRVTERLNDIAIESQPMLKDGNSNVYAASTCTVTKDGVTCTYQSVSFKISRRGVEVFR